MLGRFYYYHNIFVSIFELYIFSTMDFGYGFHFYKLPYTFYKFLYFILKCILTKNFNLRGFIYTTYNWIFYGLLKIPIPAIFTYGFWFISQVTVSYSITNRKK